MDFQLTDEQRMVQATVREFARQEILPRAAALDHTPVFPSEIIQKAAALGLMGMVIPEAYGGAGMDPVSYVVAQEELARASAGLQTIITVNNSLVCDPIFHFGTEDQKRRYLPRLSSGASLGCYCLTEPAYGSDAMSLRTDARRAALEEATAYAAGRRQFGRSIGEFQAIQWMLADMATRTDAARLLMLRAAYLRQQGTRYTREASMAKLFASETAMWVTHKAVQIFGGYGYIQDYPVERYFRDAKITEIYEGTSEIQRIVIARNLLEGHA